MGITDGQSLPGRGPGWHSHDGQWHAHRGGILPHSHEALLPAEAPSDSVTAPDEPPRLRKRFRKLKIAALTVASLLIVGITAGAFASATGGGRSPGSAATATSQPAQAAAQPTQPAQAAAQPTQPEPSTNQTPSGVQNNASPADTPDPMQSWCSGDGPTTLQALQDDGNQMSTDAQNLDLASVESDGQQLFQDAVAMSADLPPLPSNDKFNLGLAAGWYMIAGHKYAGGDLQSGTSAMDTANGFLQKLSQRELAC